MPKSVHYPIIQLAREFHDLAFTFGQYCFDHWNQLTPQQRAHLRSIQQSLLDSSEIVDADAIGKILCNLKLTLDELKAPIAKAHKAVQQMNALDTVFDIGSAATVFAALVAAGQFPQVPPALQALLDVTLPVKSSTAIAARSR
jgi:hypothetical protein